MPLSGGYLLDTNILVHLVRNDDLGQYLDKTYTLSGCPNGLTVSIVTWGELKSLARQFNWSTGRRATMAAMLGGFIRWDINDPAILDAYADIDAWSRANGRRMGKNDVWIAATAIVTSTTIRTTDKDFDHLDNPDSSRAWRVDRDWVDPSSKLTP
jgi:tRNA(fMet)-specific endonuclease VapC